VTDTTLWPDSPISFADKAREPDIGNCRRPPWIMAARPQCNRRSVLHLP
jgi:hypothetical protein